MDHQIKRLTRRYQGLTWDDVLVGEWKRILGALVDRVGQERMEAAVTGLIDKETFLDPAKLEQYIPAAERKEHRYCDMCEKYEGWIHVLVDGEKVSRVMRCQHDGRIHVRVQVGPSGNRMWMDAQVYNGPVSPEPKKYERPESKPTAKPVIPSVAELAKELKLKPKERA